MEIIDDLLSTLNYEAPVMDMRQGPFQTAVPTRYCGLASTAHDLRSHHDKMPVKEAGLLLEKDPKALAYMANSPGPMESAIGMATINSLIEVDEQRCVDLNAGDLLEKKGHDKRVAIVGYFLFIPRLRKVAKEPWVIERNHQEGDFPEAEAENLVPQAEVIGITGTAFTNHSIGHLLGLCNSNAYVIILGGTAPLSSVLFSHGINAISGTMVVNPALALFCVSQEAIFRQIKGIRLLTMKDD